ncbi:DUF4850 domain-containing protein [Acinetobacter sp. MD2(2019)]|uniref:DUF4850 domain-containing protein n=1 Tax=Acinetobacter sp. MD2(2019) TaxID=2605273 RepID=UPI002D1E7CD3|nr:DUF4850 domain-containing protein [Acinetobacter sp. MD2(2019)]MEB3753900.1 DUF4850 domain-containing protein [Acinetobacter sp. MD2(2019)]
MNRHIIKYLLVLGCVFAIAPTYAAVSSFNPTFPHFSSSLKQRKQENQTDALGEVAFKNKVTVPFYGITASNPIGDGLVREFKQCTAKTCQFDFKLSAEQASQLKLLDIPEIGVVLVPRTWQDIEVDVGANGTGRALIMSPDQKQAIKLYDSSVCAGCGMPYATLYFPNLLKQSVEYEYGGYQDRKKLINIVHPSKQVAFFSYQIPNLSYKTHGVAKYIDDGDFNFREIKVTLAQPQQHLVGTILNFYHFTH